jgi:hypothetical protein
VQLDLFYSVFQSFFVSELTCIDKAGICLGTGFEVLLISGLLDFGGYRYDDMVLEAVLGLKEPYGSSNASIANYIEVPCFYEQHALSAVLIH